MLATGALGGPLDPPGVPGSTDSVRLPGTPISGPTTIAQSGHYYLTRDISVPRLVSGVVISANDVSLDLGGFTISGDDTVQRRDVRTGRGGSDASIFKRTCPRLQLRPGCGAPHPKW